MCAAHLAADKRAPPTTVFSRTVLELYSHSRSILNDPIFKPQGSHQLFACHKSMKDFPRSFKALPSVQRYRALSNANLQHESGPPKKCETPLLLWPEHDFAASLFQATPCQKHSPQKSLPKRKMLIVQNTAAPWREHDFQARKILKL